MSNMEKRYRNKIIIIIIITLDLLITSCSLLFLGLAVSSDNCSLLFLGLAVSSDNLVFTPVSWFGCI